jgi:hypothetical protein
MEEDITQRKPMSAFERLVQIVAFAVAGVGAISIVGYVFLLWAQGYGPTTDVDPGISGTVGDFIGGVAGSLFALSATLLFYLTLTLQRKEFQNSLHELRTSSKALKATEEHHRNTLTVMQQEKEFNVCLAAINDLSTTWKEMLLYEYNGSGVWALARNQWSARFKPGVFFLANGDYLNYLWGREEGYDIKLDEHVAIGGLTARAYWIAVALDVKELAEDDRNYLAQIFAPVLDSLSVRLIPALNELEQKLGAILADQENMIRCHVNGAVIDSFRHDYVLRWKNALLSAQDILAKVDPSGY